jgi:hypothetical protein
MPIQFNNNGAGVVTMTVNTSTDATLPTSQLSVSGVGLVSDAGFFGQTWYYSGLSFSGFIMGIDTSQTNMDMAYIVSSCGSGAITQSGMSLAGTSTNAGGFISRIPDGTQLGGNQRGQGNFELQTNGYALLVGGAGVNMPANTFVPTGANQFYIGAGYMKATGTGNVGIGGNYNENSTGSNYCVLLGGNIESTTQTFNGTNTNCTMLGGRANNMNGFGGTALQYVSMINGYGMATNKTSYETIFGTNLDVQNRRVFVWCETTNATTTIMGPAGTQNIGATPPNAIMFNTSDGMYFITGLVTATVRTAGGNTNSWKFTAYYYRSGGGASTIPIGSPTVTNMGGDAGASTWTVTLSIGGSAPSDAFQINCTGQAATNIRWAAYVDIYFCRS